MKTKTAWLAAMWLLPLPLFAQAPDVITMDQEPHHHLALHNEYVKVFKVEVSPGDSIVLHRHDQDTVAIAIGDQLVTVGIPGKPDVHQKNADAQVRLQRGGYMHSTHVDGDMPYHTIAVELMRSQTNFHNVCAVVLPGQPLNCPEPAPKQSSAYTRQPLLESDETQVLLVRVHPHQAVKLGEITPIQVGKNGELPPVQVIVALDGAAVTPGSEETQEKMLQPGDFVWTDRGPDRALVYWNGSDKETRFVEILFPHAE